MTALHELTALEQGSLIATGDLSPVALADHYLARIGALDGALGAFVTVTADLARSQAAAAEAEVARARRAGRVLGPLHGVPVAVKDVSRIEGVRCTFGSRAWAEEEADIDDHVVARMRAAGLVILGTTNTPEFALPCYTENAVVGSTANPWDAERSPGGSSGGSAAAVAARLAPLAHGTDAGGSVRIPASCCGIVGLRPSRGRVSNGPIDHEITGLSSHGALARTAHDAAALVAAMAGVMPGDSSTAPNLAPAPNRPLRVALMPEPMVPGVEAAPEVLAGLMLAAEALREAGHVVDEVDLSKDSGVADAFAHAWSVHAAGIVLEDEDDEALLMPFTRFLREQGRQVTGVQLHDALAAFRGVGQMLADLMLPVYDVFLTPVVAHAPPRTGAFDTGRPEEDFAVMSAFMPYTPLANIAGLPSIAVPVGVDAAGLPLGALVTGRYGEEPVLIAAADAIEAALARAQVAPAELLGV